MYTHFTKVLACAMFGSALFCSSAWAVNKCTGPDGAVVFQDAPCAGKGEALTVRPASGTATTAPAQPAAQPTQAETAVPAPPSPPGPSVQGPTKSQMEVEADMCLAWYRPLLRDPKGAYYTNISKEKRVFSMDLHATNGFGGYVVKRAACEIHNGKLNDAWTKNHAKWGGWAVE